MENHSYGQIAGSASAPYLNRFAHRGTLFTDIISARQKAATT